MLQRERVFDYPNAPNSVFPRPRVFSIFNITDDIYYSTPKPRGSPRQPRTRGYNPDDNFPAPSPEPRGWQEGVGVGFPSYGYLKCQFGSGTRNRPIFFTRQSGKNIYKLIFYIYLFNNYLLIY
jgi:hypothetical protein